MNANFIDKSPSGGWLTFNEDVLTFRSLSDDQISDFKTSKKDWYYHHKCQVLQIRVSEKWLPEGQRMKKRDK